VSPAPSSPNPISRLLRPDPYQDLFRILADSSDAALAVLADRGQRILSCNHAFLLLTGHSRPETAALLPADLFPDPSAQEALTRLLGEAEPSEDVARDIPLRTREGQTVQVDLEVRASGPGRSHALLTVRPSSQRKQAEAARRSMRERLASVSQIATLLGERASEGLPEALNLSRALLDADAIGLYRVSPTSPDYLLVGSLPEGFPASLPSTAIKPLHHPGHWALGQRPEHVLHKSARAAGLAVLLSAPVGASTAWIGSLIGAWRDPSAVPEDAEAMLSLIAGLCDASIRIGIQRAALAHLEKTLLGVENELQGQFAAAGEGVLGLDGELRIDRANPAAAHMLGYPQHELEGIDVREVLVGPEDISATLLDALGNERQAERPRLTLHRRDGTPFSVHLRAVPQPTGSRRRLLVLLSDQSERKAIEDRTEMLAQRALLGEVTAIFAHEVRNPINNISTGVQLVASRLGKDHPQAEALDRIRKECIRLDQLMGDVLFFARPLELKIEPLDLADLTGRLLSRWEPRLRQASIEVHTAFDPSTPLAAGDSRTLEQVIVNLISNALQAMGEQGTLSVTLCKADSPHGPIIELKVADTGPGIPVEIQERIFEPFFTTKKDGTGLGLAISRRILMAHKGMIRVESFPDAGTVFTVQVPAADSLTGRV
jgi:two-component system sensor histidine kinase AtoS